MELVNYTEIWVRQVLDEMLAKRRDICTCEQCRLDMLAMALNRLKPNYVVSQHGSVYTKIKMLEQQQNTDVIAEVVKAMEQVSKNPRHLA
ncbi:MAG: late competence development ComFB family protein [Bacillota bacterium]|jgi:competence protein ComFB|uniref:Competence protein ComFB n=1 Tax=Thermanaerosceptrum fracticalcis TaxID=1712410 RepID=A0A7G6E0B1_THEFR|nr:late competence development ComFB family protein [Thermanaerosceptrum fracticalcis]MBZ4652738.1 Late competence development protein ComFB [Peptococcaceae bacterium]QNB45515.1 competence protein ComFB [Thermanaerosceptrum fracticalcis]